MKFKYLLFFSLFMSSSWGGFHEKNRPFGHNLSHTDYFPENSCSVGLQVVACGKKRWAIGTSPFLISIYNMNNIYFLTRLGREINGNKKTLQVAYFNTFSEEDIDNPNNSSRRLNSKYQQHSVMAYYIYSQNVRDNYRLHWNTSVSYFFDDKQPFSLRRPTYHRRKYQLNFTTLHEVKMTEFMGIQGELGMIHLEDRYPRVHTGASLFFKSKHWLFQLGFTLTSTPDGLFVNPVEPNRFDYQQELRLNKNGYNDPFDKNKIKEDFSMHPEIAIQYLF
jgi:hypothetical protein